MKWLDRIRRKREKKALEVLRRTGTSMQEFLAEQRKLYEETLKESIKNGLNDKKK